MFLLLSGAALGAPNAPTNLRGSVVTSTSFSIVWDDNSTDETNFDMLYSFNGGATNTYALGSSAGTGTIGVGPFTGLTGWNTAVVQIRATNASGSSLSNTVNLTFNVAFNAPNTPLTKAFADGTAAFMWTDNSSSEAGYIAEIATASGGPFSTWGSTGSNLTGISGGLAPSTTYYFRAKAFQGTAASPTASSAYTSVVSVTTPALAPPTGLAATTASETNVNLAWADNCAIEHGYAIYYKPSTSGSYTLYTYTAANATSYSFTGLAPGTAYTFQVATAFQSASIVESTRATASATTKDGFTSRSFHPITYNQPFSYQAVVSTTSSRTSWNITSLPGGLSFNSASGIVSGTPTVTGVFACPMTASFASGWTTNGTLTLRIIRAPGAPVTTTSIGSQTLASGGNTSVSLTNKFSDPDSESAVRLVTNLGTMDFILYNTATPQTVTNFLSYVNNASNSGNYNGAVFHRAPKSPLPNFVIQGGGYKVQSAPNNFTSITKAASPVNEPGIAQLRGTVAMAKNSGDPNSATDEFFVNLSDNSASLDDQNGGFTAFARVAGNGMAVADAINALPTVNATVNIDGTPTSSLTDWPVTSGNAMDTTKMVTITSATPVAVLSYTVTGNTNPSAVSASISGTNVQLTGTAGGQSTVTVTATDLDGNTVAQTFTVTINQAPAITSSPPSASGTVGVPYNFTYTATGFPAPAYSVTSGALPPGLTLSGAGAISGSPTAVGTFSGVVTASNAVGSTTQSFSVTVHQLPAFTNGPPPATGKVGTAYNFSFGASGSPAPTFAVTTGTLPTGLSLSTAGVISGTPTAVGTFTGVVTASNAAGAATQGFSITVNQVPAFTNGPPPSSGSIGNAFSFSYAASGSPAPTFSVTAGDLPPGLSLSSGGVISGSPSAAGSFSGTVTASNAAGNTTQNFSISVPKMAATVALGSLEQTFNASARTATATTTPANLNVVFSYDGSSTPPTAAGSYTVVGTITEANYTGSASGMLVIAKATAGIALGGLSTVYDGTPKAVSATTTPPGLALAVTYDGSATPPSNHGSYTVTATVNDTNYTGSQTATLLITGQTATNWRTEHFSTEQLNAGLASDDADPDGDGLGNLAEYALGTDPLSRNPALSPSRDANGLTLIFTRPKDLPDVTYAAESSDDLGGWSSVPLEVTTDGPVQTVRVRDPLTAGNPGRRFIRLLLTPLTP